MTKSKRVVKVASTKNKAAKPILPTTPNLIVLAINHFMKGSLPDAEVEFRSYGIALMETFHIVERTPSNGFKVGKPSIKAVLYFARCWSPFGYHKRAGRFDANGMTKVKGNNVFLVDGKQTIAYDIDRVDHFKKLINQKSLPSKGNWEAVTGSI